ncbi:MAG TPA: class I SAM-dependent methyltransferase [Mycobacteriales bacterium]|nr:class I SAM-dependent methyltransferase [Mycobacteriales bacterium]
MRTLFSLGSIALSNFVDDEEPLYAPMTLAICDQSQGGCSFVQLKERGIDPQLLYRHYWYRSGINEAMRAELNSLAACVVEAAGLEPGDTVVDIGSNDGTLLRGYAVPSLQKIGFEPATNVIGRDGDVTIIEEFFGRKSYERVVGDGRKARAVTAIAMFYDLEDPNTFVDDVRSLLADDGVFVVQMAYLSSMLNTNGIDNVCHEHVGYYSLGVLMELLDRHGLVVRDVKLNATNGGSFRVYVQHRSRVGAPWPFDGAEDRVADCLKQEQRIGTNDYDDFVVRVTQIKDRVRAFVDSRLNAGDVFHVYGASTKGNTLLQVLGLDRRHIAAAAERSPEKFGRRTVATDIPIVSEAESRAGRPDYYIVLPWHFREGILRREEEYLRSGGQMLFCLPRPELVSWSDGGLRTDPLAGDVVSA